MSDIPDDIFGAANFALMGHAIGVDLGEDRKVAIVNDVARAIFMERQARNEWMSISTAPKDGTKILIYSPSLKEAFAAKWKNGQWQHGVWSTNLIKVSHWMPLPPSP